MMEPEAVRRRRVRVPLDARPGTRVICWIGQRWVDGKIVQRAERSLFPSGHPRPTAWHVRLEGGAIKKIQASRVSLVWGKPTWRRRVYNLDGTSYYE